MKNIVRNAKGFTLVELMIVVAIIGILAAIAIPQFAAYRIRGFNSAAVSDIRNLATAEAGLFTDIQSFASTDSDQTVATPIVWATGRAGGAGEICVGPNPAATTCAISITPGTTGAEPAGMKIGVSNGVHLAASVPEVDTATPRANVFTMVSKHLNGNTYFGQDSHSEAIYQILREEAPTLALEDADVPEPDPTKDVFAGENGPGGKAWQVK
ncbi:prepilin-type N-terminal cleavage/methylation domain-containing protein [Desulfobulbus sp.]|uniref:type IV pilin protein n=1 Tax=Desulfobulbus sp. TaxID=895 RepID=UPI00286F00A5|nr:prepilin-type N-terminal cleavage/methylation domain-containing protein [Desulfobulbus sp.]